MRVSRLYVDEPLLHLCDALLAVGHLPHDEVEAALREEVLVRRVVLVLGCKRKFNRIKNPIKVQNEKVGYEYMECVLLELLLKGPKIPPKKLPEKDLALD